MRLVAGNGIRLGKIRPEGPINPQKKRHVKFYDLITKIHEKNPKNIPPNPSLFFRGGGGRI
jgi:hypothetical protein